MHRLVSHIIIYCCSLISDLVWNKDVDNLAPQLSFHHTLLDLYINRESFFIAPCCGLGNVRYNCYFIFTTTLVSSCPTKCNILIFILKTTSLCQKKSFSKWEYISTFTNLTWVSLNRTNINTCTCTLTILFFDFLYGFFGHRDVVVVFIRVFGFELLSCRLIPICCWNAVVFSCTCHVRIQRTLILCCIKQVCHYFRSKAAKKTKKMIKYIFHF